MDGNTFSICPLRYEIQIWRLDRKLAKLFYELLKTFVIIAPRRRIAGNCNPEEFAYRLPVIAGLKDEKLVGRQRRLGVCVALFERAK